METFYNSIMSRCFRKLVILLPINYLEKSYYTLLISLCALYTVNYTILDTNVL